MGLTIGQAAQAAGVTRKAVRGYEAKGLIAAADRTIAGYRLYDDRARTLGVPLDDIREVLAIRDGGIPPCASVSDLVDNRIAELDATVAALLALRDTLAETRQRAANCSDEQPVTVCGCGIIEDATDTTA